MLIEAASTRLAIDLLESLRKHKFEVTDIRVSYITKQGNLTFRTFINLDSLKQFYQQSYGKIVAARRNPFTTDIRKAQLTPIVQNGLIIGVEAEPINSGTIDGLCRLGAFVSVERFKARSTTFNYDVEFICQDVSDVFQIIEGRSVDLRRNSFRQQGLIRQKNALTNFIKDYQTILAKLYRSYNANLYVDLCYVNIGYVEESILLYSIYFALVKAVITTGLRLSVLDKRYLKKIE